MGEQHTSYCIQVRSGVPLRSPTTAQKPGYINLVSDRLKVNSLAKHAGSIQNIYNAKNVGKREAEGDSEKGHEGKEAAGTLGTAGPDSCGGASLPPVGGVDTSDASHNRRPVSA